MIKRLLRRLSLISFILVAIASAPSGYGATYEVPGTNIVLTYEIIDASATITICNNDAFGSLAIPKTVEGVSVTSIGDAAFGHCSGLTGKVP